MNNLQIKQPPIASASPGLATMAGLCASLVGIGLARFAYTPLIPALIAAQWFPPTTVVYLGAANLAGYLAGALLARPMAGRIGAVGTLRLWMTVAVLSFFACSAPLDFAWFFVWRVLSGIAGGVLMALAAPTVLPHIAPSRRGLAAGAIFTGVGLGIAASGTLVPLLMQGGLTRTWLGLGVTAGLLTALAWRGWPRGSVGTTAPRAAAPASDRRLTALYVEYALNAAGQVPHMVFLVDFVARGLGRGLAGGAHDWILFGLGAMAGPLIAGSIADRIGFGAAVRGAFLIQAVCAAALGLAPTPLALAVCSIVLGALVPGIVALMLGRTHELLPGDAAGQGAAWSRCTIAFAVGQAGAAYAFSLVFAATGGGYAILFLTATGAFLLALTLDIVVDARHSRR